MKSLDIGEPIRTIIVEPVEDPFQVETPVEVPLEVPVEVPDEELVPA